MYISQNRNSICKIFFFFYWLNTRLSVIKYDLSVVTMTCLRVKRSHSLVKLLDLYLLCVYCTALITLRRSLGQCRRSRRGGLRGWLGVKRDWAKAKFKFWNMGIFEVVDGDKNQVLSTPDDGMICWIYVLSQSIVSFLMLTLVNPRFCYYNVSLKAYAQIL
jgi:hypothetical protein